MRPETLAGCLAAWLIRQNQDEGPTAALDLINAALTIYNRDGIVPQAVVREVQDITNQLKRHQQGEICGKNAWDELPQRENLFAAAMINTLDACQCDE